MREAKMKNNKYLILLSALLTIIYSQIAGAETSAFTWKAEIRLTGQNTYKVVQLDRNIYNKMANGSGEIRLYSNNGEEVPYFLYHCDQKTDVQNTSFSGEFIGSFVKDNHTNQDFMIRTQENHDVYGNSLSLTTTNSGFAKSIDVFGSHDGIEWSFIQSGLVYYVDNIKNNVIPFDSVIKFPYFRIVIPDNSEGIQFQSVHLTYAKENEEKKAFIQSFDAQFQVQNEGRETILELNPDELYNLKISQITFITDDTFMRNVSCPFGSGQLYNLIFDDTRLTSLSLNAGGKVYDSTEPFRITIANKDDAPIDIERLVISYECDRLVFKAEPGETYTLAFGNDGLPAPEYDIMSYAPYILNGPLDSCVISPAVLSGSPAPGEKDSAGESGSLYLNLLLGALSVVMIIIIIQSVIKAKNNDGS